MPEFEINIVAVVIATVAGMAIGFAWFSPVLFGNSWLRLVGLSEEDAGEAARPAILGSIVATIVLVVILSIFIDIAQADNFATGALIGFLAWVGFVATTSGVNFLFSRRPLKLWLIEAGDHLVGLVVAGAIIGVMG
jgi:hypothetical protein